MRWWLRGYLVFAAVQGFGIGLTGLVAPAEMQIPLRITPLNARFVAALYVSGAVGVLLAAMSKRVVEVRVFVIGFGLATLLILVVTLIHWSDFMADGLPHRPIWIFDYVVDPVLALVIVPVARLWPSRRAVKHALTPLLRAAAVIFGALSVVLLLLPDVAAVYWPWQLPPVLGQVYGCFILTFAVGAALASRDGEPRAIRNFLIATEALCVLVLVVSGLHFDRFKPEPVTAIWFMAFALGALAFGGGLAVAWRWQWRGRTLAQA